jgi:hypothetical protein
VKNPLISISCAAAISAGKGIWRREIPISGQFLVISAGFARLNILRKVNWGIDGAAKKILRGYRWFESISLQRRVLCEPLFNAPQTGLDKQQAVLALLACYREGINAHLTAAIAMAVVSVCQDLTTALEVSR